MYMPVIFTCFAGRERYLKILLNYIEQLVKKDLVDDVHIWDYTRNIEDSEFLKKSCERYKILTPKNKENYGDYYRYYRSSRYPDPDTVLIKCDDDIVYIDIDNFKNFIDSRIENKNAVIFSPSVINNPLCGIIQIQSNLLPNFKPEDIDMTSEGAQNVHKYFIDNRKVFIKNSLKTERLCILPYEMKCRFNINFIAILGKDFDEFFDNEYIIQDDECYLGIYAPNVYKRSIYVDRHFVVSHMAFTSQRKQGFNETNFLNKYQELST